MYRELLEAVDRLPESHLKTLNLGREWLNSLLPHVLQKANRVKCVAWPARPSLLAVKSWALSKGRVPCVLRSYGVMTEAELVYCRKSNEQLPRSRQLLAVPFVGKDTPSPASEFSHPDVLIGLSILAYRYQGLRFPDFCALLQDQVERLEGGFGPPHTRAAYQEFNSWVQAAGGRVRGTRRRNRHERQWLADLRAFADHQAAAASSLAEASSADTSDAQRSTEERLKKMAEAFADVCDAPPLAEEALASTSAAASDEALLNSSEQSTPATSETLPERGVGFVGRFHKYPPDVMEHGGHVATLESDAVLFEKILPLDSMNLEDREHVDCLYRLIWREPLAVASFLFRLVLPSTLEHANMQLSASGQEIGGDALFAVRLGFSGTPSELLPVEMGSCRYEAGTDGRILQRLTSPEVVSHELLPDGWTIDSLLDIVAARQPPLHALIDTGALISGRSNYSVAKALLTRGLREMEGVVFIDEEDRQMVLLRDGWRVLQLAQCGIAVERRFTFYDQVHTIGQVRKSGLRSRS